MEIEEHEAVLRDVKKLHRFAAPRESLDSWKRLFAIKGLSETPGIDIFKGFGAHQVYKARVVPLKENVSKAKGYRVVFQIRDSQCMILLMSRHGVYKTEKDLMDLVKERLIN